MGDVVRALDATERAAELDETIDWTDAPVGETRYDRYGLTKEEREIIEQTVGDRDGRRPPPVSPQRPWYRTSGGSSADPIPSDRDRR